YFLPYIGYFQLFKAADEFIIYDNIEYTKKGWINRNQFVLNGKTQLFSIPLEKSSDYLDVVQKIISPEFEKERKKILAQIHSGYR
ncbi:WbqC family protein, partial [Vibrio parahaemolyticus]|uniref:WbqC family protein n=2 Tax=Pseudomonadati TaxID=3379134 RepID=UPI001A8C8D4A